MENTIENALSFLLNAKNASQYEDSLDEVTDRWSVFASIMNRYASACSAPSSIGEEMKQTVSDEEIYKACPDFDLITKGDFAAIAITMMEEAFISGAKWMRSRLSERKIVLPTKEDGLKAFDAMFLDVDSTITFGDGWNAAIEYIKRLNGIN